MRCPTALGTASSITKNTTLRGKRHLAKSATNYKLRDESIGCPSQRLGVCFELRLHFLESSCNFHSELKPPLQVITAQIP